MSCWYASEPQLFWAFSARHEDSINNMINKVRIRCGFWFEWLFKKAIDQQSSEGLDNRKPAALGGGNYKGVDGKGF